MQSVKLNKNKESMLRGNLIALLFLLPFTILYTVFTIYPVFQGGFMSLHKWGLMGNKGFVGLENYKDIITDKYFWESLLNTTKFVVYSTPPIMITSMGLALLVNRATKTKALYRTVFYLPNLLSVAVISSIFTAMAKPYSMGFISNLMTFFGIAEEAQPLFLADKHWAWVTVVVATLWWTQGYNMMLYISALQDIPDHLYEAASIDGATPSQQLFKITLPMLNKTTALILMLQLIASFKVFQQIKLITSGGPGRATRPIIMYIYELGFTKNNKMGYACAVSFVLFFILIILTVVQRKLGSKED